MRPKEVVLVSGASRGLGWAVVERFLGHEGVAVAAFARRSSEEVKEALARHGDRLHFAEIDVTDGEATGQLVRAVMDRFGRLDVLVNNAAVGTEGLLAGMAPQALVDGVNVNVTGALLLARHAVRRMLRQGSGNIINVASLAAFTAFRGLSVYAATKAAMVSFTNTLAREVGPQGIRVNCVAPGYLRTEMTAGLDASHLEAIRKRTPLKRLGEVGEVVDVIEFLASERSRFMTGQTLIVDGGLSC
jgi:3-oxoacyl-[acyl-carrier protein] reductase